MKDLKEPMLVKDLISRLAELHECYGNLPVSITDGYLCVHYLGAYDVAVFDGAFIDIGIGGTLQD